MDKVITITGGSGSIGSHLCKYLLKLQPKEIRVISNDILELSNLNQKYPSITTLHCDIRNTKRLNYLCKDTNIMIHLAAFKYAPESELFRDEVYSTNVEGTKNVLDVCLANNVETILNISSDKAVNPLGFYARTKRIGELLTKEYSELDSGKFINLRFGNVFNSSNSVVPIVVNQIRNNEPITITNEEMMRYYISMDAVSEFIINSITEGENGDTLIPPMVRMTTGELINSLITLAHRTVIVEEIGFRLGEKMCEDIMSYEERFNLLKLNNVYKINDKYSTALEHNIECPLIHGEDIMKFIKDAGVII